MWLKACPIIFGPMQCYPSTTWFRIKSLPIAKMSQNQPLSKENDILTLNFSYPTFFSHILFVNAIYTSLNPHICCRTSQPKCVSVSRIFWLHSRSKNIRQQELFKQQETGTGRFVKRKCHFLLPSTRFYYSFLPLFVLSFFVRLPTQTLLYTHKHRSH